MSKKQKKFLSGALLLSAASLITKMLSAIYKVPFQNLTGNQGFYVYQQLYPFYGLSVAFSLTGFPMFISKVVSETDSKKELKESLSHLMSWLLLVSAALFLTLQVLSGQIASWMGDAGLQPVVRAISYVFLLVPFLSIARGYFQGTRDMKPTAYSQVGEQFVRVFILLLAAYMFTQTNWTVYEMGERAMHSAWISGLAGTAILFSFIVKAKSLDIFMPDTKLLFSKTIGKRLFKEGTEITVMSSLMIFFQFIDSFTVYNGLLNRGYAEETAMSLKGIYDRGQPFVQLGLVAGIAFATSLLPILRKHFKENNHKEWERNAVSVLRLTTVFSAAAAIGLAAVMPWLNHALFSDFQGVHVLQVFVLSTCFASLILSLQSIIQSTDKKTNTFFALFIGLAFKLLMNQFVVERVGLMGSSTVTVMSLILVFVVSAFQIPGKIWQELAKDQFVLKLFLNLMLLFAVVNGGVGLVQSAVQSTSRSLSFLLTLSGVGAGALVYLISALKWNLLTEYETEQLPFSRILKKVGK